MKTVNLELEEGEEARPIEGYEWYLVTSFGRVFSLKSGKFMKGCPTNKGYLQLDLCKDGQRRVKSIHRLVAQAFLPNYSEDLQVNHLDECKTNNHVINLEMCSCKDNINHGTHTQRMAEKRSKKVFCLTNGVTYPSIKEASRQLNIDPRRISDCCNGKITQTKGYQFNFI